MGNKVTELIGQGWETCTERRDFIVVSPTGTRYDVECWYGPSGITPQADVSVRVTTEKGVQIKHVLTVYGNPPETHGAALTLVYGALAYRKANPLYSGEDVTFSDIEAVLAEVAA